MKHRHMTYFWLWVTVCLSVSLFPLYFAGYNRKRLLQIGWTNNPVFIYIKHSHFATTRLERKGSERKRDSNHLPIEIRLHPLFEINYHEKCAHASMRYKTPHTLSLSSSPFLSSLIRLNHRPNIIQNEWNRSKSQNNSQQFK